MNLDTPRSRALAALLAVAGLLALYAGALRAGFLNDDWLFLEDARTRGLGGLFATSGGLANYFRPLSREVWFGLLAPLAGGHPLAFHLASFAVFVLALVLLADLLREFAPAPGVAAGVLWFALLPLQRVNLMWVSASQDLLALAGVLGALACFRRGRDRAAAACVLAAVLSKESALPAPALLLAWAVWVERQGLERALRRVAPSALALAAWAAGEWHLRASAAAAAHLRTGYAPLAAAFAHLVQSLVGADSPEGLPGALATAGPSVLALALLAPLAAWLPATPRGAAPAVPAAPRPMRVALRFSFAWLVAFTLPVVPVTFSWSAYYYTLAAVGGAVLVALAARALSRWGFVILTFALVWWHAIACAVPAFAVVDDPWGWTGHLTPYYFQRGAALSATLRAALARVAPAPAHGTRFFFATLPPFAGFQMGNGAAIRQQYRDPSLESHFYTQFSESTAADHPCVLLFWNGVDFERLYANARDPFFQAGTDLLLLGRPAGAIHAFHRGLAAGETPADVQYWLGWAWLWNGGRSDAERAWLAFGAHDDSVRYVTRLADARTALARADSTAARRLVFEAMRAAIGRPEPHALLGALLGTRSPKFALLETLVAARLDERDAVTRRALVAGLVAARLDDAARRELDALQALVPDWSEDSLTASLARTLDRRSPAASAVVRYPQPRPVRDGGPDR